MLKRARFFENPTLESLACEYPISLHHISILRAHGAPDGSAARLRFEKGMAVRQQSG